MEESSPACVLAAVLVATGYRGIVCQVLSGMFMVRDVLADGDIRRVLDGVHAFAEGLNRWILKIPSKLLPPGLPGLIYRLAFGIAALVRVIDTIDVQFQQAEALRPLFDGNCEDYKNG